MLVRLTSSVTFAGVPLQMSEREYHVQGLLVEIELQLDLDKDHVNGRAGLAVVFSAILQ